jgi:chemotaxis signal transduction protein
MTDARFDAPWVVMRSSRELFAVSACHVQEMVSTPVVTSVPDAPTFVRGIINLRGQVLPLVDLRVRFGQISQAQATEDLIQLLDAREQDHRRWVDELVASVRERRPFTLTTDPHACAFGKWYDGFKAGHLLLEAVLARFDAPHKRIHAIGREIVELIAGGAYGECDARIREARDTTLVMLGALFADAKTILRESHREIAVVVKGAGPSFAVAVDAIESVERLEQGDVSAIEDTIVGATSDCIAAIARRSRDGSLVMLVHESRLLTPAAA